MLRNSVKFQDERRCCTKGFGGLLNSGILGRSARPARHTRRPAITMPARQAAPKPAYRIRNWNEYNDALVRRGSLTLWVSQETLQAWRYRGPARRGAQFQYSDLAIECLLTLKAVYHLTLRATEGFAHSLFAAMQVDLPV